MMICAYNNSYLSDAMDVLGNAMDTAVRGIGMDVDAFMRVFIASGVASGFEHGFVKYVSGMSGTELLISIMEKMHDERHIADIHQSVLKTPEYWTGGILAYWQWRSVMSFSDIMNYVSASEVLAMYNPLHEVSEERSYDSFCSIVKQKSSRYKTC